MGLFDKLRQELIDIIEWTEPADSAVLAYRFPRYQNEIKMGARLTVRDLRPEKSDPQGLLERKRAAHQFAIHRLQAAVRQGAVVQPTNLLHHQFFTIGRIDRRVVLLLELHDDWSARKKSGAEKRGIPSRRPISLEFRQRLSTPSVRSGFPLLEIILRVPFWTLKGILQKGANI